MSPAALFIALAVVAFNLGRLALHAARTLRLRKPLLTLRLGRAAFTFKGSLQVQITLQDDQILPFVAPSAARDKRGNPAKLPGAVSAVVSDPAILTLTQPDPTTPDNPASGVLVPAGPLGKTTLTFHTEGDLSSVVGVTVEVEVVSGPPVALDDPVFGSPRDAS